MAPQSHPIPADLYMVEPGHVMRRRPRFAAVSMTLCLGLTAATLSTVSAVVTAAPALAAQTYTVQTGDTLIRLANRWKVTTKAVLAANPKLSDADRIRIGQVLNIPANAQSGDASITAASAASTNDAEPGGAATPIASTGGDEKAPDRPAKIAYPPPLPGDSHTVVKGDTLSEIAHEHGKTVQQLMQANKITNADKVKLGQVITIPKDRYTNLPSRLVERSERQVLMGYFDLAAAESGVDPSLLKALAWVESGWQPRVLSNVGAMGICQLMPATASELAMMLGDPTLDPWDPVDNIRMGARHLRFVLDTFDGDTTKAIAAYYQGHAAVQRRGVSAKGKAYATTVAAHQKRFTPTSS
ncbi:MAG: LysM peptidoglycan-binding domain-containing protein [Acidimicrobiia bacterium]